MIENFRLRVFRVVARHLNFSRAAEELLLTQPAVTQQIKALEEELGVPLFHRGSGRIALTAAGKALVPHADRLRRLSDEAVQAVAAASGERIGDLAVGASQTIAHYVLPAALAVFCEAHAKVRVSAVSGNTDGMLQALLAGEIDVALVEGPEQRKDVHMERFMEDRMVLAVPAAHPWAGKRVTSAMLPREPLLMREFGSGSRRVVEQALLAHGVKAKDLQIRMEFDSTEGLLSAVEAGLGLAFVSRWAVRNQLALGTLKLAEVRELKLSRWFSMARLAGPTPGGNVEAFRAALLSLKSRPKTRR